MLQIFYKYSEKGCNKLIIIGCRKSLLRLSSQFDSGSGYQDAKESEKCFLTPCFICSLFTELAAFALVQLASEALFYQVVQAVTQWLELHLVNDFIDESVLQ